VPTEAFAGHYSAYGGTCSLDGSPIDPGGVGCFSDLGDAHWAAPEPLVK
jgi:hypothetical protein